MSVDMGKRGPAGPPSPSGPATSAGAPNGVRSADPSTSWIAGQPLADMGLRRGIDAALTEVASAVPSFALPPPHRLGAQDTAELAINDALDQLAEALGAQPSGDAARALTRQVGRLHGLLRELNEVRLAHRMRALARVQAALSHLREVATTEQAMQAVATETLTLGFSRVILSRVVDSRWVPEVVLVDGDPAWAAEILAAGRAELQELDHMILESEMVRRRVPMLVHDVQSDPRAHRAIADASFSRSYVTAPLMPEGRVIGFLHADCYIAQRDVDEFDRDLLWMFAEGAGYALQRTVLQESLRDLRDRVRGYTDAITKALDEVVNAETEIARLERQTAAVIHAASRAVVAPDSRLHALLTRRELEIAELMAAGHTNAAIARRLTIAEGTVKSHVSNLLRKLRATNRAQAVSTIMRLTQRPSPRD
jgi:DNA-binding CsgD family transcriptional regulator